MNRALKNLIRLYPAPWRERYGKEFEALLEDTQPNWMILADVLKGALTMRLTAWNPTLVCTLAAILLTAALALALTAPKSYSSEAVIQVEGTAEATSQAETFATVAAFSRRSLTDIINATNLYPRERLQLPLEDVIDNMRKHIQITPVNGALRVSFDHPDRFLAQRVTENLVGQIIAANANANTRGPAEALFELLDPPSLAQRPASFSRSRIIAMVAAWLTGMLMFIFWMRRGRPAKCPTCGRPMPFTASPQTADGSAGHR